MTNSNQHKQPVEPLDRAIDSVVESVNADSVSEREWQAMETRLLNTIEAQPEVESAQSSASLLNKLGLRFFSGSGKMVTQWAASAASVAALVVTVFLVSAPSQSSFAAVVEQLQQIESMRYTSIINAGDQVTEMQVFYQAPGSIRVENQPRGTAAPSQFVQIMDLQAEQMLMLFPQMQMAMQVDLPGTAAAVRNGQVDPLDWFETLKSLDNDDAQSIGEKLIRGARAEGFRVEQQGVTIEAWADLQTHQILQVVVTTGSAGQQFRMIADVETNVVIDPALFSMQVPAGYRIGEQDKD